MEIINSCEELINHLYSSYGTTKYCCGGYIEFQGNLCEVEGFFPDRWCVLMPSSKFPKTVFSINNIIGDEEHFILCIYKGNAFVLDQTLGVKLPMEIYDELVATIQGYSY